MGRSVSTHVDRSVRLGDRLLEHHFGDLLEAFELQYGEAPQDGIFRPSIDVFAANLASAPHLKPLTDALERGEVEGQYKTTLVTLYRRMLAGRGPRQGELLVPWKPTYISTEAGDVVMGDRESALMEYGGVKAAFLTTPATTSEGIPLIHEFSRVYSADAADWTVIEGAHTIKIGGMRVLVNPFEAHLFEDGHPGNGYLRGANLLVNFVNQVRAQRDPNTYRRTWGEFIRYFSGLSHSTAELLHSMLITELRLSRNRGRKKRHVLNADDPSVASVDLFRNALLKPAMVSGIVAPAFLNRSPLSGTEAHRNVAAQAAWISSAMSFMMALLDSTSGADAEMKHSDIRRVAELLGTHQDLVRYVRDTYTRGTKSVPARLSMHGSNTFPSLHDGALRLMLDEIFWRATEMDAGAVLLGFHAKHHVITASFNRPQPFVVERMHRAAAYLLGLHKHGMGIYFGKDADGVRAVGIGPTELQHGIKKLIGCGTAVKSGTVGLPPTALPAAMPPLPVGAVFK